MVAELNRPCMTDIRRTGLGEQVCFPDWLTVFTVLSKVEKISNLRARASSYTSLFPSQPPAQPLVHSRQTICLPLE